jgi:hypothetical protein
VIETVWPEATVTDESLTRCISEVRRAKTPPPTMDSPRVSRVIKSALPRNTALDSSPEGCLTKKVQQTSTPFVVRR